MPSKPWAVPTGPEVKNSSKGADQSVQEALSNPRVPLVPHCTRVYFLATTPWFAVEGSDLRYYKYLWLEFIPVARFHGPDSAMEFRIIPKFKFKGPTCALRVVARTGPASHFHLRISINWRASSKFVRQDFDFGAYRTPSEWKGRPLVSLSKEDRWKRTNRTSA